MLIISRGPISYRMTDSTAPVAVNVPSAPTISSVTTDYGQLSTGFTSGDDGGSVITNYEYSTNGGTSWTTRSPASTASPIIINGLGNNTSYNIRIRAINSNGAGTQSNQIASSTLPYEAPVCTWGGFSNPVSTFTITNILSTSLATYSFTPTTGTVSFNQSTGVFTVNTSNEFEVTIVPKSLSLISGPSKIVGRKNITYYQYPIYGYGQTGWSYPWCTSGCNGGPCRNWPNGDPFCQVPVYGDGAVVGYGSAENSPPANYQKIGNDWVRL